jgi:hypothetical protein
LNYLNLIVGHQSFWHVAESDARVAENGAQPFEKTRSLNGFGAPMEA